MDSIERQSDEVLLARYVGAGGGCGTAGGREAMGELARRYVDFVYAVARRAVGEETLAEDVTQAVFLVLARKAGLIGGAGRVASWLFRTTRYTAANAMKLKARRAHHERRAARREATMVLREGGEDQALEDYEKHNALEDALAALPERERQVVLLRHVRGEEYGRIAELLGMSEGAVRKRVSRGIERMRKLLARDGTKEATSASVSAYLSGLGAERATEGLRAAIGPATTAQAATAKAVLLSKGTVMAMAYAKVKVAVLAGVALLVMGGVSYEVVRHSRTVETADLPAVAGAPDPMGAAAVAPGKWVAKLKDGTTSELIAIGDLESGQWWRADGSAMERPEAFLPRNLPVPKAGKHGFCIVTTTAKADGSPVTKSFTIPMGFQETLGNEVQVEGAGAGGGGGWYRADVLENAQAGATMNYRLALSSKGPTRVKLLRPEDGAWTEGSLVEKELPELGVFGLNRPKEVSGKAQVDAMAGLSSVPGNCSIEVLFMNEGGDIVWGQIAGVEWPGFKRTFVSGVALAKVGEIDLRVIHYDQWVEFRNLPLAPGGEGRVEIVTSDGAMGNAGG